MILNQIKLHIICASNTKSQLLEIFQFQITPQSIRVQNLFYILGDVLFFIEINLWNFIALLKSRIIESITENMNEENQFVSYTETIGAFDKKCWK